MQTLYCTVEGFLQYLSLDFMTQNERDNTQMDEEKLKRDLRGHNNGLSH